MESEKKIIKPLDLSITGNKFTKILTLCGMYFAQGVPFGFVTYLLASYMADNGFSIKEVGNLTAIATLPWIIKWIWGPVIDRFTYRPMGRRRPWIIFAQAMMVVTMAIMVFFKDITADINLLFALVFLNNMFASMQDVSVDALAVEVLAENERGFVNGLMFGSASGGAAFSGKVLGPIMENYGMREAIIVQAGVLCLIMMLPLLFRERRGEKLLPWTKGKAMGTDEQENIESTGKLMRLLMKAFSLRSAIVMVLLAVCVKVAVELHGVIGTVYYIQQKGWSAGGFADLRGSIELYTLSGCFLGGFLADRIGHKKIALMSTILFGVTFIIFGLMPGLWGEHLAVKIMFALEGGLYGALSVSLFAMCMDLCLPAVAGTQFTAYMAMMNLSATIGKKTANYFYTLMGENEFMTGAYIAAMEWFAGVLRKTAGMFEDAGWKSKLFEYLDVAGDSLSSDSLGYGGSVVLWGAFQMVVISVLLVFIDQHQRKKLETAE